MVNRLNQSSRVLGTTLIVVMGVILGLVGPSRVLRVILWPVDPSRVLMTLGGGEVIRVLGSGDA